MRRFVDRAIGQWRRRLTITITMKNLHSKTDKHTVSLI